MSWHFLVLVHVVSFNYYFLLDLFALDPNESLQPSAPYIRPAFKSKLQRNIYQVSFGTLSGRMPQHFIHMSRLHAGLTCCTNKAPCAVSYKTNFNTAEKAIIPNNE